MEKRYFNLKDFQTFLVVLEENKETKVLTESVEDGSIETYNFLKMTFSGSDIILYNNPYATVGIIQDTPVAPWEDYVEGVYNDMTVEGEYRMFIEA